MLEGCYKVTMEPSLLQPKQPQLSQSSFKVKLFQSSDNFHGLFLKWNLFCSLVSDIHWFILHTLSHWGMGVREYWGSVWHVSVSQDIKASKLPIFCSLTHLHLLHLNSIVHKYWWIILVTSFPVSNTSVNHRGKKRKVKLTTIRMFKFPLLGKL